MHGSFLGAAQARRGPGGGGRGADYRFAARQGAVREAMADRRRQAQRPVTLAQGWRRIKAARPARPNDASAGWIWLSTTLATGNGPPERVNNLETQVRLI